MQQKHALSQTGHPSPQGSREKLNSAFMRIIIMRILVTGGVGFIGSHLVERLTDLGSNLVVLDKSAPRRESFQVHHNRSSVEFHQVDLLTDSLNDYFDGIEEVWHLAANPDVRVALENTKLDLEQNILVTFRVLEAMKENQVKRILLPLRQQSTVKLTRYQHLKTMAHLLQYPFMAQRS